MTDTSIAAVELLACELPDTHWQAQRLHRAALTLRALSAQLEAANQRAYSLAYAIAGGEDVPGLLDSVNTDELCKMLKSQRAWAQDAEFSARAEGKAKGLRDAAACLGHITRFEDLDAILALIPADTPAPAKVTLQEAAKDEIAAVCVGCGKPANGMCWTDCGMSLCGAPICDTCRHIDETHGWSHGPRAPAKVTLGFLRPIWKDHSGEWHGPKVERWSIPEDQMVTFFNAALCAIAGEKL